MFHYHKPLILPPQQVEWVVQVWEVCQVEDPMAAMHPVLPMEKAVMNESADNSGIIKKAQSL